MNAHTNRLIHESSPYLRQHAHNPVDWYPWGAEAFDKARQEDKPIFLSIGYSACHWCHVMERESFEDEEIAHVLNRHFVSIKVDREERPDVDEVYMRAVQTMTGSGGWPLNVFLTPELHPFFGGTYFFPRDQYGRLGFLSVIEGIARMWSERRSELTQNAHRVLQWLQEMNVPSALKGDRSVETVVLSAVQQINRSFDPVNGGFGTAPKFPSCPTLRFLLHFGDSMLHTDTKNTVDCITMVKHTLEKMARGGIYDHLGGGFHRYAVDESWLVPHFEKMLYDNAQLAELYAEMYALTGDPFFRKVAVDTLQYALRDMQSPQGGFYAAEDADSEGKEGVFYLWEYNEIHGLLPDDEARLFCTFYNVQPDGNFTSHEPYHDRLNVLHTPHTLAEVAEQLSLDLQEAEEMLSRARKVLQKHRNTRVRPFRDEKIIVSWNGLMIRSLCHAAQYLGESRYRDAAVRAAQFIRDGLITPHGELLHSWCDGSAALPAVLDDYVFLAEGFLALYETTFASEWLLDAERLCNVLIDRFGDPAQGGFFSSDDVNSLLPVRVKSLYDVAEPSPNASAAGLLLRMFHYTGNTRYRELAQKTLGILLPLAREVPLAVPSTLKLAREWIDPLPDIVIMGDPKAQETTEWLETARRHAGLNSIIAVIGPEELEMLSPRVALFQGKECIEGKPTAYVCHRMTCSPPVTDKEMLGVTLKELRSERGIT